MSGTLSQQFCERAKPRPDGRERVFFDDAIEGLTLRVGKRKKRFELRVQWRRGGERGTTRHKLGAFPEISAAEARKRANAILGRDDPREKTSLGPTFKEAWEWFKAALEARGAAAGTVANYELAFRQLKHLHEVRLRTLSTQPEMIANEHTKLTKAGTPIGANAMARFVRAVYRNAQKKTRGLPADLPTSGVDWNEEVPRKLALAPADLPAWEKERLALKNPIHRELALFLALSGLRRRDACSARWDELDMRCRVLRRPKPKGGEERAFNLPLSRAMLRCLWRVRAAGRMLYPEQAQEWIFPAASASGHIEEIKSQKLSIHGHALRRSYSVFGRMAGVPHPIVKQLLNHAGSDVTEKHYTPDDPMLEFLCEQQEKISRYVVTKLNAA
jgi:integrase